jgi:hypothetical protein
MVDDILSIQKCSNKSLKTNAAINAFVELKKLKFSDDKCNRIHLGKQTKNLSNCPELKIHEKSMKNSTKEKYLGDYISNKGTTKATIKERKAKGYAAVAEILAILRDIPLGQHALEIGLKHRQAMFINGVLFNSEAWHDVSEEDMKALEAIDEHLDIIKLHLNFCICHQEKRLYAIVSPNYSHSQNTNGPEKGSKPRRFCKSF